ncbi:MAG: hypothetical protein COA40_04195 [Aequorivita sp.]|nr:MAG: hypothetical protein COA40_04195 [Aequorivita sp.]
MKKSYIIILFLFGSIAHAQIVNIPDASFKNALVNRPCVDLNGDGNGDVDADTNNDGEIQLNEAQAVLRLDIAGEGINSLEGIQSFLNLEYLRCGSNNIISLDIVTQNFNLKGLVFEHLGITNLDVTQMTNLEELNCHDNALSVLDISQNPNLKILRCSFNQLTNIDVSENLNLESLVCYANQFTNIDISQNANLIELNCAINQLANLDISQNLNLESLDFSNNSINSFNPSQNINLEGLKCSNNGLTSLDFSENYNLKSLNCNFNQLTSLDISDNPNIYNLTCENNQLVSLNLKNGNNTILVNMKARENPNLECIQVDDEVMANSKVCITSDPLPSWCKDATASYSEECILEVEDYANSNFIIYPNPVEDFLNIDSKEVPKLIEIYSTNGVLIIRTSNTNVDVSNLASGLYFSKVYIEGRTITKKFIKS